MFQTVCGFNSPIWLQKDVGKLERRDSAKLEMWWKEKNPIIMNWTEILGLTCSGALREKIDYKK